MKSEHETALNTLNYLKATLNAAQIRYQTTSSIFVLRVHASRETIEAALGGSIFPTGIETEVSKRGMKGAVTTEVDVRYLPLKLAKGEGQNFKLEIVMLRHNPETRKAEVVYPVDSYEIASLTPVFWGGDRYYTIPGYSAENCEAQWLAQFQK